MLTTQCMRHSSTVTVHTCAPPPRAESRPCLTSPRARLRTARPRSLRNEKCERAHSCRTHTCSHHVNMSSLSIQFMRHEATLTIHAHAYAYNTTPRISIIRAESRPCLTSPRARLRTARPRSLRNEKCERAHSCRTHTCSHHVNMSSLSIQFMRHEATLTIHAHAYAYNTTPRISIIRAESRPCLTSPRARLRTARPRSSCTRSASAGWTCGRWGWSCTSCCAAPTRLTCVVCCRSRALFPDSQLSSYEAVFYSGVLVLACATMGWTCALEGEMGGGGGEGGGGGQLCTTCCAASKAMLTHAHSLTRLLTRTPGKPQRVVRQAKHSHPPTCTCSYILMHTRSPVCTFRQRDQRSDHDEDH